MASNVTTALNFLGTLFRLGRRSNTVLRMIGGVSTTPQGDLVSVGTGWRPETNYEFATNLDFTLAAPSQPARLEGAAAPAAVNVSPTQTRNVVQLFTESVNVTYLKASTPGRFTGVQTAGQTPVDTERAFQIQRTLEKIAQDVNWSFVRGVFSNPADPAVTALGTRGILNAITTNRLQGTPPGTPRPLTRQLLTDMYRIMVDNAGVTPESLVLLTGTAQMARISALYETVFQERERMVGGLMVRTIYTPFGVLQLALELDMPAGDILFVNQNVIQGVYLDVPGKPTAGLFYEELSRTGSAEVGHVYGQLGIDHGPEWAHGRLSDLAV